MSGLRRTVTAVVAQARAARVPFLAAAVAYYGFVSLVPLLLLGLAVGSLLGGEAVATAVVDEVGGLLTPEGESVVRDAVADDAGRSGATVVGLALLTWSGLRALRALDTAVSQVYDVHGRKSLPVQLLDGVVVLGTIGAGAAVVTGLNAVLPAVDALPAPGPVGAVVTLLVLPAVFLPLYVRFPGVPVGWREAVPGAVLAAVGWTALGAGFQLYADLAGTAGLYGVLGGVLLVVTFLYLAASVILVGAVTNAVLAGRTDEEPAGPEERPEPPEGAPDVTELAADLAAVRERVDDRTVDRDDLEAELRAYVRRQARRSKARGWGPYLVLLYGTAMTIGAFALLSGVWAILAMVVVWLSTLGLYTLMLVVGAGLGAASAPGRLIEWVRSRRS